MASLGRAVGRIQDHAQEGGVQTREPHIGGIINIYSNFTLQGLLLGFWIYLKKNLNGRSVPTLDLTHVHMPVSVGDRKTLPQSM